MNPTNKQQEAIKRLAASPDAELFISFYKDVIRFYADVRQLRETTQEEVRARQLACNILEEELVNRLMRNQDTYKDITTEEYE